MSSPTQNTAASPLFTLSCSFAVAIAIIAFIKTVNELRSLFFCMMKKELYAIEFSLLIFILYLITTLRANNLDNSAVLVEEVADDQGELFFNAEVFEEDEFEGVVQDFSKTHPDLFLERDWDNADHRVPVSISHSFTDFLFVDILLTYMAFSGRGFQAGVRRRGRRGMFAQPTHSCFDHSLINNINK